MLEINDIYSGYDNVDIIKGVNVTVNRGENLCIVGPNGCGKSTLLKSIASIIDYKGSIKIDGKDTSSLDRKELATKIGLMSQISQIYFPYTVYETVALGRYAHSKGAFSSLSSHDRDIILDSIEKVKLYDYKDKMINELSGGQLQRVFLARTMAQNPDVILLDEPTNHLDLKHQIELLEHLTQWIKDNNKIVVGVLHDLNLVQYFADNVLILNHGNVISYGKPEEVLKEEILKDIYGLDIKKFMINILKKWE
ncbi:ABC transporter ATP-binding protein [Romboutsia maritimum]|uniref:ABC transporter ATP-binding protein n=1 Tax=Romboutsia maritimum TaxID=2020948 RepID=A0A371ITP3_9FIRM|nr:ABC transporter ATP-binding protein [Romboutsia maritimum]RDY23857.1 ABC transporter ATP-binding protein [Romboutsia maritimum]